MKRNWVLYLTLFCGILLSALPQQALAGTHSYNSAKCLPLSLSQVENETPGIASCYEDILPSVCLSVAYISPEDKQIQAALITARMSNRRVNIIIEDNAPVVTLGAYGGIQRQCKLLMVQITDATY
jgi:hypothetical protein